MGQTFRQDTIGCRYKLDESGSRTYAGSGRPPWIPTHEWKIYDKDTKVELTAKWKAKIQRAVDEAAALHNSTSSPSLSSGAPPAVAAASIHISR